MCNQNIIRFYNEVCENLDNNYKIILEPPRDLNEEWIEYDEVKWEIEPIIKKFVEDLNKNKILGLEEKIIKLYEYICLKYIYDANVLYFFKRDDSNPEDIKYIAVDWYGRIVGQEWIENRKTHNRRICYEFARFFAKSINLFIKTLNISNIEAFMLGDKDNLHYVVGIAGEKYSVILDLDDFNSVKDLTRIKMGLKITGIHVLRDEDNVFMQKVEEYNKNKLDELQEIKKAEELYKNTDIIKYFQEALNEINKYNIDPQGVFECLRHLIEKNGIKIEKIWKEDKKAIEKRYERCLYFEYNSKTYLLDSIDKSLKETNITELDKNVFVFNPEENIYNYSGK